MKEKYTVFLDPIPEGYQVHIPDLPSAVTFGRSIDEAVDMAFDALSAALLTMEDHGAQLPVPTPTEALLPRHPGIPAILSIDTTSYRKLMDTRAVRKNVSMPAWMAHMAEQRGINCSQLLQDALRAKLEEEAAPAPA